MRHLLCLGFAIVSSGYVAAAQPMACPIPGELQHWQADYCMATMETDDIIAASSCLEHESQIRFRSPCNGKYRYKQGMCELSVRSGSYTGSVDHCVKDPLFLGPTVRNGGA